MIQEYIWVTQAIQYIEQYPEDSIEDKEMKIQRIITAGMLQNYKRLLESAILTRGSVEENYEDFITLLDQHHEHARVRAVATQREGTDRWDGCVGDTTGGGD